MSLGGVRILRVTEFLWNLFYFAGAALVLHDALNPEAV